MFYSISNCQRGLAGVSFGNFLIKQVVEEICRELPKLTTFVTLSPVPNFAAGSAREREAENSAGAQRGRPRGARRSMERPHWWTDPEIFAQLEEPLMRAAAWYFLRARRRRAACRSTRWRASISATARGSSASIGSATRRTRRSRRRYGLMVNYQYDLDDIEKNHEAYAEGRTVVASSAVQRLLRPPLELVPIAG